MTAHRPGIYGWTGGTVVLPVPTEPEPTPGYTPPTIGDQPYDAGMRWSVAVGEFPGRTFRGQLWDANVVPSIKTREAGGNEVTITCPATPQNMRILGDPISGGYDQAGRRLFSAKNAISRELFVGCNDNGKTRWRFYVRDPWVQSGGTVTIKGVGIVGGLTSDRVIGAPTPLNLLTDRIGSFESGDLTGWQVVGSDIQAEVEAGGPDGEYHCWLTGTPDGTNFIQARYRYSQPEHPWGRARIAGTAYVHLPGFGIDIDDYGLVTVAIYDAATGAEVWPAGKPDLDAAVVESDMARGSYDPNPVEAIGYLPAPPFLVDVWVRLHPVHQTEKVWYDGAQLIRREATSTEHPVDITRHPRQLFEHAQKGRDKVTAPATSAWGVGYTYGTSAGKEATGTWWHPDGQSMNEALEAVCSLGPIEVWDDPDGHRTVKASKRRGSVRNDLGFHWWDLWGEITWQVDPGAQHTAVRATSAAGSIWGGSDEGAIDTRQSNGQVIDVILSGPVGMTPEQLKAWAVAQLATLRLVQATSTLIVSVALGSRIAVGDSIRVPLVSASAGHFDWFRVTGWTLNEEAGFIALDVGTDPALGGT